MAFEGTKVRTTRNGVSPVDGAREDLVAGDVVVASLADLPQTPTTYEWLLIGRPEFSAAGGAGGNAWPLGTSSSATFTVDADPTADVGLDGTYVVQCTVEKGSPLETRFSVELSRTTGILIPAPSGGTRTLRKPGMFESLEDTVSIAGVVAGYSTALNRLWEYVRLRWTRGADVASAASLAVPPGLGSVKVTGTTAVDFVKVAGRKAGSDVRLLFAGALTLHHNTAAPPAGFAALNLAGSANLAVTANSVVTLWYDGTVLHEVSRKVA